MDLRIKLDLTNNAMRRCIDLAAHAAASRFKDHDIDQSTLHHVGQAAAEIAVEQFKAWCNSELALLSADYELRASMISLTPAVHRVATGPDAVDPDTV